MLFINNCYYLMEIHFRQLSAIVDNAEVGQSGVERHSPSLQLLEVDSLVTKCVESN